MHMGWVRVNITEFTDIKLVSAQGTSPAPQMLITSSLLQANVFEEDFKHEREDRTKAVSRHEEEVQRLKLQLEEQLVHAKDKARDQELVVKMLHDSMQKAQVSVEVAQEEVQVKTTQIKQYKKQVDTLKEKVY